MKMIVEKGIQHLTYNNLCREKEEINILFIEKCDANELKKELEKNPNIRIIKMSVRINKDYNKYCLSIIFWSYADKLEFMRLTKDRGLYNV